MVRQVLFTDSQKKNYTADDLSEALRAVGAHQCKVLFTHTDLTFGFPNPELKRTGYLQALYEVLQGLGVKTLLFPSFSYSFCNHEDYHVRNSRTSMGALIEYIRKQPEVRRSLDPLLSILVAGERMDLVEGGPGSHSFGPDSGFDRLHKTEDVKFLFLGADFSEYFTYIHYIEKVLEVPYRFDMFFTGMITDYNGSVFPHTHGIHTQCGGVKLKNFLKLKQELLEADVLKRFPLGDSELVCISEEDIYREASRRIRDDPFAFVEPYTESSLTHIYTFGKNGERVTHC